MTLVLILVFGVLFGMIGGAAEGDEGFVFGALLGILAGLYTALRVKFGRIERRVKEAEEALNILSAVATPTGSTVSSKPPVAATPETPVPEFASEISPTEAATRTVVNDGPTGPAASTKDSPDPWLDDDRDAFRRPPRGRRSGPAFYRRRRVFYDRKHRREGRVGGPIFRCVLPDQICS